MEITPSSLITILKSVPLDNKYKNTLYFDTTTAQQTYFTSKVKYSRTACTYVREQKKLRVDIKADNLFDCNYVMYQNPAYGTKWFYAFVTKVEYVSDNMSYINFEIDVMQTRLVNVDYVIKPSFVEREHVSDDTIGANLVDEKLEIGPYVVHSRLATQDKDTSANMTDMAYLVAVSDTSPLTGENDVIGGLFGNLYSGLEYWYFHKSQWQALQTFIDTYIKAGKSSAIVFISSIPAFLVGTSNGRVQASEVLPSLIVGLSKPLTTIDGYTPKNKKLFTSPYNLLYVSNNQGTSAEFRYEDFSEATGQPDVMFGVIGNIAPSPTIQCCPIGYKAGDSGYDGMNPEYAIPMQGYPLCSWTDDVYKAWLVQNGVSTAINTVAGIGSAIGGVATGNVLAGAGGVMAVANQMTQLYRASLQPDQARGNINAGSLNIATGRQEFYFQKMQIRAEFAKKIDNFFSMFGYKVNEVKVPNLNTRPYWNYVKTIDVCLIGSVPADDMEKIQSIYNTGITFWKSGSQVGNYNLDNSI